MKKSMILAFGLFAAGMVHAEEPATTSPSFVPVEEVKSILEKLSKCTHGRDKDAETVNALRKAVTAAQQATDAATQSGKEALELVQTELTKKTQELVASRAALEASKKATEAAIKAGEENFADAASRYADALEAAQQATVNAVEAGEKALEVEINRSVDMSRQMGELKYAEGLTEGRESVTWIELTQKRIGELKDATVAGAQSAATGVVNTLASVYDKTAEVVSNPSAAMHSGTSYVSGLAGQGKATIVDTWNKGNKEKAAIIAAAAVVTVVTTYGVYRVVTSKKAKKLYKWMGLSK